MKKTAKNILCPACGHLAEAHYETRTCYECEFDGPYCEKCDCTRAELEGHILRSKIAELHKHIRDIEPSADVAVLLFRVIDAIPRKQGSTYVRLTIETDDCDIGLFGTNGKLLGRGETMSIALRNALREIGHG